MAEPLRAIVYTRVSTEEQAEGGTSLEDQRERGIRTAELRGACVVKVCEDAGVSGTRYTTRPGIMEALKLIENGTANALICTKIDRLARNAKISLEIAERVANVGALILTCDGMEYGKSPVGQLLLAQLAAFAQFERATIRERSVGGRIRRAMEGVQTCRSVSPYGYHIVTHNDVTKGSFPGAKAGDYHIIADEAHWVRRIYAWYDEGLSLRGIARALDSQGVPTQRGAKGWKATTIRRILENTTYRGIATYGRQEYVTGENLPWLTDSSKIVKRGARMKDRDKPIAEIPVPAIVQMDLWVRVSERLAASPDKKKSQHGGNPLRKYLLTSMTRCPECGGAMKGLTKHRRTSLQTLYYTCRGRETCSIHNKMFRADNLHESTLRAVVHLANHPAATAAALKSYEEYKRARIASTEGAQGRERLTAALERTNAEIAVQRRAMIAGMSVGDREDPYLLEIRRLTTLRDSIEAQLLKASLSAADDIPMEDPETAAGKMARVAEAIVKVFEAGEEDYSTAEKQALLYRIIESVTPSQDGAEVVFKPLTVHGTSILCTVKHTSAGYQVVSVSVDVERLPMAA